MVKIVTGDETGIIKIIDIRKKILLSKMGDQSRSNGVCSLAWLPSFSSHSSSAADTATTSLVNDHASSSSYISALTRCGNVDIYDTLTGTRVHRISNAGKDGIYITSYQNKFITCSGKDGIVRIFNQDCNDATYSAPITTTTTLTNSSSKKSTKASSSSSTASSSSSPASSSSSTGFSVLPYVDPTIEIQPTIITDMDGYETIIPPPPPASLSTAKFHHRDHLLAVGGNEFDVQLWDVTNQTCTWKADPLPNDDYDIRVPVWVKDITFLHDPTIVSTVDSLVANGKKKSSSGSVAFPTAGRGDPSTLTSYLIATVSAHRFVRIYDTRASKDPIRSTQLGDYGYTSVVETENGKSLIIGDTIGTLTKLDTFTLQPIGVYKGPVGCIKAMESTSGLPYMATVGLDRMLRMYNVTSKQLVRQVYLKQRLTAVLYDTIVHQSNASVLTRDEDMIPEGPVPGAGRKAQPEGLTALLKDSSTNDIPVTEAEENEQVWDELNRRSQLVQEQNEGKQKNNRSSSKKSKLNPLDDDDEEKEEDNERNNRSTKRGSNLTMDDDDDEVDEKWGDGGDDYSDDDDEFGENDDDDDDIDNEELDDEDAFNDDFDDDFDDNDDDDDVAALVDSKKTAKELLHQTKKAQELHQKQGKNGGKQNSSNTKNNKKRKHK